MARIFNTKVKTDTKDIILLKSLIGRECMCKTKNPFIGTIIQILINPSFIWADVYNAEFGIKRVLLEELYFESEE